MPEVMTDQQPDAFVMFDLRPVEDRKQTAKKGYVVMVDEPYARITPAGGNLIVDVAIKDFSKRHWERFGEKYKAWSEGREIPEDGMAIRHWPLATPAFIENCIAAKVRTVEELAEASEPVLEKLGMGARNWRQKAEAYLEQAKNGGAVAEENAQLKIKVEEQAEAIDRLIKDVNDLTARLPLEAKAPKRAKTG